MDFDTIVRGRRSIRGYKPDPIPKDVLKEIIDIAARAPSSMNTQPWHLHVISGEPLDRIRAGNTERNLAGVPSSREFRVEDKYEGVHRDRQVKVAVQLFEAMGIERHDAERRQEWVLRGFRQFDAPVSVIVAYDKNLQGDIRHFDLGAITYGLVLAAWSRGIGAVINSQGIMQSPVVREHAGIPENHVIQTAVAMGYPDDSFPANAVVSTRRPVEEVATFIGFED
ncbi:nitroreductase [Sneathiella sp. HT1-7]|uniref:nitroreductase n=1 Tax=Sneathiella sp. HT1-7 TaxID=2887192 RepID=UPI001D13A012|nr:nitroreductase [Sneathiella sp. HT1-7]MCC3304301.1 nitroreductase [Sneathiella sp. HT1-7]